MGGDELGTSNNQQPTSNIHCGGRGAWGGGRGKTSNWEHPTARGWGKGGELTQRRRERREDFGTARSESAPYLISRLGNMGWEGTGLRGVGAGGGLPEGGGVGVAALGVELY